jgi:hypothetical protein
MGEAVSAAEDSASLGDRRAPRELRCDVGTRELIDLLAVRLVTCDGRGSPADITTSAALAIARATRERAAR